MDKERILTLIDASEMLLVGIGSGFGNHPEIDVHNVTYDDFRSAYEQIVSGRYDENIALYNALWKIIEKKNYFVLDTNIDGLIMKSSIPSGRIVCPCGSVDRVQCLCVGEDGIRQASEIYTLGEDICCKVCGARYTANIHGVQEYNESAYLKQWNLYNKWLSGSLNKKITILELGSDFTYASVLRWPFEKIVMIHQKASLIRVNKNFWQGTPQIKEKIISVPCSPSKFLESIVL